ncbi:solute carrier organic anion transporter family member 4A1-like [Ylistrum balloti]|uniref:solute carrier organic anion transporter family member 4A1-like n=1 Tax=Ylistrum balloti TaxID=509963 RepID=UPI0029058F5D|nr:solute carrier organic anion transporter family member 4A1-like [Ylistrum balloti]
MCAVGVANGGGDHMDPPEDNRTSTENGPCKWWFISPRLCQRFRTPRWLLFVLCCASFIQMMAVSGFVNVVISSIERRYDLTSAESGLVASAYDISSAILILPVSYFGGLGSKPRYIGLGFLLFGLSCILFAFPHFLSGLYNSGIDYGGLCMLGSSATSSCVGDHITTLSNYKYMFYASMILMGAGTTPLYTLATAFIEESVPVRSSSFYLGIYYGASILGPALGFLLGGLLLDVYVDFNVVDLDSVTIDSTSSRFVGAWWVGFVVCGVLAVIITIPIAGFPPVLPNSAQYMAERRKEVYKNKEKPQDDVPRKISLINVWKSLKLLITNPTYVFLSLGTAVDGLLLVGISTFIPKFIEIQFGLPSSTAALYVGFIAVPGGAGGTLLGGYIIKRFDMDVKRILQVTMAAVAGSFFFGLVLIISCPSIPLAGVNILYGSTDVKSTSFLGSFVGDSCHNNCGCSQEEFSPICGRDGLTYYSPCYAGCQTMVKDGEDLQYYNCTCVGNGTTDYQAVLNKCKPECPYLPVFMVILLGIVLLTFFSSMPFLTASLRCVPPDERSFALGIQLCVTKCLGFIPGPILFGWLIDLSCLIWNTKCGEKGSCFFYDNKKMSNNLLAIVLVAKAVTTILTVIAYLCYNKGRVSETDNEQETNGRPVSQFSSQETGMSEISKDSLPIDFKDSTKVGTINNGYTSEPVETRPDDVNITKIQLDTSDPVFVDTTNSKPASTIDPVSESHTESYTTEL